MLSLFSCFDTQELADVYDSCACGYDDEQKSFHVFCGQKAKVRAAMDEAGFGRARGLHALRHDRGASLLKSSTGTMNS